MNLQYVNIIDAVQYAVDKISKQEYKDDKSSPPKFTVSQMDKFDNKGNVITHEIVITIEHMGWVRTRTIFPRMEYQYGYETLKDEMKWLYNSTM